MFDLIEGFVYHVPLGVACSEEHLGEHLEPSMYLLTLQQPRQMAQEQGQPFGAPAEPQCRRADVAYRLDGLGAVVLLGLPVGTCQGLVFCQGGFLCKTNPKF